MLKHRILEKRLECGTDEAGRGCLAGPVTAAAVILPAIFSHDWLNDSKKLSLKKRIALKPIIEKEALAFAIAHVYPKQIDEVNILQASIMAMHKAIDKLKITPEYILVDGNKFHPYKKIKHKCIVKGDAKYRNIAAASILAKTYRDEYMEKLHQKYPDYLWNNNKGYPTKRHRLVIKNKGITPHHRNSFKLLPEQLSLQF